MTKRDALNILMLSPFYFRMELPDRKALLNDFCKNHCPIDRFIDVQGRAKGRTA